MASLPSASSSASLLAPGRSLISPTQPPRLKPSSPAGSWMTPSSEMLSLTTIFPIFRSFRWRCQLARRRAYWRCVAEGATPPLEGCQIRPRRRRVAHDTPCHRQPRSTPDLTGLRRRPRSIREDCGLASVVSQKFVEQIVAGTREGAGPTAEAKEGVAPGGAHLKMRDDDGPGPPTRASDV